MSDPKEIFLAPYCEGADDRRWCEDDMAGDWCHCDECEGKPSVRYVRSDLYAELEAKLAEAREALTNIDALGPYHNHICEISDNAIRGLVIRMSEIAAVALAGQGGEG